jgi:hypothetical protein
MLSCDERFAPCSHPSAYSTGPLNISNSCAYVRYVSDAAGKRDV